MQVSSDERGNSEARTSGIRSLKLYCDGKNVELSIAALKSCGLV
jgi:hypothetical protein